jgi:hypothetical protein
MSNLLPELQQFAALLDAQPGPIQAAFQYVLCLLMVEAGKMQWIETIPGENGALYVFETVAGDRFSVVRPQISQEVEAELIEQLREILNDEGL